MSYPRGFDDLPGAAEYLARLQEMRARHDRERNELVLRQMGESREMTETFLASIHAAPASNPEALS